MAEIVTRAGKGSPLTFAEVDANFTNLNDDKLEISGGDASATVVTATGSTTARSLANRAADVVNVKDFGAVGDGVADDTAAINAATASAADSIVLFPAGEYSYTFTQPSFNTAWHLPYTNTNLSSVGLSPWGNAVAKTSNLYFPDGPHSGEMNAAQLISLRAKGSGANGPISGDYALVINSQKENWPNGDVGEIGGLYFKVIQGVDSGDGPSDASCILADIYQSEDTGFSCFVEATNGVVSRSTNQFTKKSRVFLLPLDETAGSKDSYGFSVIAELGTHDDAILIQDAPGFGTWSSVIRSNNAVGTIAIKHRKTTSNDMILEAERIGVGTETPDASAALDVTSATKGFLPPRMTGTQRDAISSPANGLVIYNTTTDKLQVRAAGTWVDLH